MTWKHWITMGLVALFSSACMVGTYEEPKAPRKPYSIRAETEARLAREDAERERAQEATTQRVASLPVVETTATSDGVATASITNEPAKAPPPPPIEKPRPAATPRPAPTVAVQKPSAITAAFRTAMTETPSRSTPPPPPIASKPRAPRAAPTPAPTEDILAAVTRPPTWNPLACGKTGPFVGYVSGFPFGDAYRAYAFHERGATACQGMCLFVVNPEIELGSGRFYTVLITNGRHTRLPVTMCAGNEPTAAGTAIRAVMGGGTEETVSVLKPAEMLAIGKIYGQTTVEVEECVLLNGKLRCAKPRFLWSGSFPRPGGPNGLGITIMPRAQM